MNTIHKKVSRHLVALLLVLAGVFAAVAGAKAYAADRGEEISVQLLRQERDGCTAITEGFLLRSLQLNFTADIIRVENQSSRDAFVRVLIAVPTALGTSLELTPGYGWNCEIIEDQLCESEPCHIYIFTMMGRLKGTGVSDPVILGHRLGALPVQQQDPAGAFRLRIAAQAVQSPIFGTAKTAFNGSGLPLNPWEDFAAAQPNG